MTSQSLVSQLSATLAGAQTLEQLVRPFLLLLQRMTGLESVYLTQVRLEAEKQDILFALNIGEMDIPEGISVDWGDTLCKRALEEGKPFTSDAAACWSESDAAMAMGIRTYVSTPIHYADGCLFGTLCGASQDVREISEDVQNALVLFGSLIQQQVQREKLIAELQENNVLLQAQSYRDPLTDLPNRRLILMELTRLLAFAQREERAVYVAFIDLDGFKRINDQYGHEIGDAFLIEVGRRLAAGIRATDLLGRLGGDEFVMVVLGGAKGQENPDDLSKLHDRLAGLIQGRFDLGSVVLDYPGASFGIVQVCPEDVVPEDLLRRADAAMYVEKCARKAACC